MMDMTGEKLIAASREKVYAALNNPEILKTCIPGCETLEKVSDDEFKATAQVKLGPISAKFSGRVTLSDLNPPHGYTIKGEGQGGVAGFAKGGAVVTLLENENRTVLAYTVNAQIGGKMAQLGARLIDASAKSMADQFFVKFAAKVDSSPSLDGADVSKETHPAMPSEEDPGAAMETLNVTKSLITRSARNWMIGSVGIVIVLVCVAFYLK
jgi:carbon monoxide dehydrogenase subunit G